MRFALALFLLAAAAVAPSAESPTATFPRQLELRNCSPVATDESDQYTTCSCAIADWIRDGDGWIAACKK